MSFALQILRVAIAVASPLAALVNIFIEYLPFSNLLKLLINTGQLDLSSNVHALGMLLESICTHVIMYIQVNPSSSYVPYF